MKTECCHIDAAQDTALLFVRGELDEEARELFEKHTSECDVCLGEVSAYNALIERLDLDDAPPCRDLTDGVMAALKAEESVYRFVRLRRVASIAALLMLVIGPVVLFRSSIFNLDQMSPTGNEEEIALQQSTGIYSIDSALQWLAGEQQADGSWLPAEWGGKDSYRVALTGISLMALQRRPELYRSEREAAANWLMAMQSEAGCFGSDGEQVMYNHGIATVALLEYFAAGGGADMEAGLRRAVGFVRSRQESDGGWGYLASEGANTSITAWQIRALDHAVKLGWGDSEGHMRRGLRWLSARGNAEGEFAYGTGAGPKNSSNTLTAMGAYCLMTAGEPFEDLLQQQGRATSGLSNTVAELTADADYYLLYFVAKAVSASGVEADDVLEQLRSHVASRRVTTGPLKGTWAPDDSWSIIGGRIYSTAMAAMVLDLG